MHDMTDGGGRVGGLTPLEHTVSRYSQQMLNAYREHPPLVDQDAGLEENISQGGYGRRQLHELIQNGADELIGGSGGRIHVVLTESYLYCANEGSAISADGVAAILLAHVSPKRGDEIGRFGLGFKSVLGVSERPEFFSREVSFGFDGEWSAAQISEVAGPHEAYPTLRIARLLDIGDEMEADPVLSELQSWATTVVRLPLIEGTEWLSEDIASFDSAFLLFSPHVGELTLEDKTAGLKREIRMSVEGEELLLEDGGRRQRWRVFRSEIEPSEAARGQAGKLQHRGKLPVVWAVPLEGRLEVGQFWAFFPLRDQTTLSGIANAPWQINDDRTGLLENSTLNEELLDALVELVFNALPSLAPEDDPGWVLDLTPARGREARCWGDEILTRRFNTLRIQRALVPDQTGTLRRIEHLRIPPISMPPSAQVAWAGHRRRPDDWAHPSASTSPTRRNRVQGLLDAIGRSADEASTWLEVLLEDGDVDQADSAATISVAAAAVRSSDLRPDDLESMRDADIVLNSEETWSRLSPDWIWIDDGDGTRSPAVVVVHRDVLAIDGTREDLDALGILPVTPMLEIRALYPEAAPGDDEAWAEIWTITREVEDIEEAAAVLRELRNTISPFEVRVGGGAWKPCSEALLPGRVVELGDSSGRSVVVDSEFHAGDLELMRLAGLSDGPTTGEHHHDDAVALEWKRHMLDSYAKELGKTGSRPSRNLLELDSVEVPGPLAVIRLLHGDACARFVRLLVDLPGVLDERRTRHSTQARYPVLPCDAAAAWAIKKWGVLPTSFDDPRRVSECVGPSLEADGAYLPVAQVSAEVGARLGLPAALADIPERLWRDLLGAAVDHDSARLGGLLTLALRAGLSPLESVQRGDGTTADLRMVVAATAQDDISAIIGLGLQVAVVETAAIASRLSNEWGLRAAGEFFRTEVEPVAAAEAESVADLYPDLAAIDPSVAELSVVRCDEILVVRSSDEGSVSTSVDSVQEGKLLYVATADSDEETLLDTIVALKGWSLDAGEREHLLDSRRSTAGRTLARSVAAAETLEDKILLAVGPEALTRHLPKQVIDEMSQRRGGSLSDEDIVELSLAVHGVELLRLHKDDLRANGLDAPSSWAAGSSTRRFVLGLGFPEDYAGFKSESRDALLHVPGPPKMPPLHDFQRAAADNIRELVRRGEGRGMLSLPTGAGKTRTAVQAIAESMRDGELRGPVLWVAQTDELCEQAISSWADNWRAVGPRETLKLARLWSSNEAQDLRDPHQVVVATMAKLEKVMDKAEYAWLSRASAVIIDEAHRAISPAYTRLLNWLDMGRGRERAPLIGLSATPFRGTSEAQTKALVNRFNNQRLDTMGENPYGMLQDMGVLSRVQHRLLAGSQLELLPKELEALRQTRRLPSSALERIGEDKGRNQIILDSILALPEDHTVLLFAASVPHAELMAGLLSAEGIPSRPISARTHRGARNHYIEQFRDGEIRVLTNYGVLTEGFDAPSVRAVFVARPTYSPNVYQQMIGRGLRGPLNGGNDLCLIVNVEDNLAEYGEALAFTEFEHLWSGS